MRLRIAFFLCLLFPLCAGWGHREPLVKIGLSLDHAQGRGAFIAFLDKSMEENRAKLLLADAKDDPAAQARQVQDLLRQGIQALVILPCDPSKAAPIVTTAHQAGIQVIALERPIPGSGLDFLIAFDRVKGGELQARALVEKRPQGGYLLLEKGPVDVASQDIREGWMNVLEPLIQKGDIRITASRRLTGTETTAREMESILAKGTRVDAVLASDGETAQVAVRALEKAGLAGKVAVAGWGEDLPTCRSIVSGSQTMTVYRPAKKLAEETAYLASKLARKVKQFDCQFVEVDNGSGKVPAVLLSPSAVDAKNLESTVVKDGVWKKADLYGK